MSKEYTPFKMKGSPAKMGGIQGTSSHASASALKLVGDREDLNKLVDKRTKLKEKEEKRETKREEGGKVLFGNLKTKRNKKKLEKVQEKIDANPKAQEDLAKGNAEKEAEKKRVKKEEADKKHEAFLERQRLEQERLKKEYEKEHGPVRGRQMDSQINLKGRSSKDVPATPKKSFSKTKIESRIY